MESRAKGVRNLWTVLESRKAISIQKPLTAEDRQRIRRVLRAVFVA